MSKHNRNRRQKVNGHSVPNVAVKPGLLTPQHLEVSVEGELVAIQIGNSTMRLHYEDALKISQWIRMRAKQAKQRCGDVSRHWSALAVLEDLTEPRPRMF